MIVPVVESEQQAQDAATGVADVVPGPHRHVTDVTRLELFGYRVTPPQINSHLSRTLKIVLPLVGVRVPVKLTHGSRLDLQHGGGQCGRDWKLIRGNPPLRAAARRAPRLLGAQWVAMRRQRCRLRLRRSACEGVIRNRARCKVSLSLRSFVTHS